MKRKPLHPGVLFYSRIIEPRLKGRSQEEQTEIFESVAQDLNMHSADLCLFVNGLQDCDEDLAETLAGYTSASKFFWMNLQSNHDASKAQCK